MAVGRVNHGSGQGETLAVGRVNHGRCAYEVSLV